MHVYLHCPNIQEPSSQTGAWLCCINNMMGSILQSKYKAWSKLKKTALAVAEGSTSNRLKTGSYWVQHGWIWPRTHQQHWQAFLNSKQVQSISSDKSICISNGQSPSALPFSCFPWVSPGTSLYAKWRLEGRMAVLYQNAGAEKEQGGKITTEAKVKPCHKKK